MLPEVLVLRNDNIREIPLWLSGLKTQLVSMRMRVQPLASLSGLRILHCHKPQDLNNVTHSFVQGTVTHHPPPTTGHTLTRSAWRPWVNGADEDSCPPGPQQISASLCKESKHETQNNSYATFKTAQAGPFLKALAPATVAA